MIGEDKKLRGQLRGYLFEIIVLDLLRLNDYFPFFPDHTDPNYDKLFKEDRSGFVELRGRGSWHQIDCPCDYSRLLPFTYPIRLLGEVKYYKKPITKEHIREFIGVIKDIQENYFVRVNDTSATLRPRMTEVGVFFSASGFNSEAENLAYAHGIKTISYANNHLISNIKKAIDNLEAHYLSVSCLDKDNWNEFKKELINGLKTRDFHRRIYEKPFWAVTNTHLSNEQPLESLLEAYSNINTSFIASTFSGVVLQFLSEDEFPSELFEYSDRCRSRVFYNIFRNKLHFWLQFVDRNNKLHPAKFYFTPPESLDQAAIHGGYLVLNEKERIFKSMTINTQINGISRNLVIELDQDWIDAIRENNEGSNI